MSYVLKNWKEWCELGNKEENGELIVEVRNSSFTGESGCEVQWNLELSKSVALVVKQAAGNVSGTGKLESMKLDLAAGSVKWTQMNMSAYIKLAAGNIELKADAWPNKGNSNISVATGNISIKSPKSASVSTEITKAMGVVNNDFPAGKKDHKLTIKVALGKVSHEAY